MNAKELRDRTDDDLRQLESELRRELWKSRFNNHSNQLDDTAKLPRLRRDIARVKTILSDRAIAKAKG